MYLFFNYPVSLGSPAIELLRSPICVFMIHVPNFKANVKIWVRTGKTLTSQLNKRNLQLLFGARFRVCIFVTRLNPSLMPLPMACGPPWRGSTLHQDCMGFICFSAIPFPCLESEGSWLSLCVLTRDLSL